MKCLERQCSEWGATDVHLGVPASPTLRLYNELVPIGREPLTPATIKNLFESVISEKQRQTFYRELELDFAHSISGVGVSLYRGQYCGNVEIL